MILRPDRKAGSGGRGSLSFLERHERKLPVVRSDLRLAPEAVGIVPRVFSTHGHAGIRLPCDSFGSSTGSVSSSVRTLEASSQPRVDLLPGPSPSRRSLRTATSTSARLGSREESSRTEAISSVRRRSRSSEARMAERPGKRSSRIGVAVRLRVATSASSIRIDSGPRRPSRSIAGA